ncbi:MAG: putative oxidoreductase [Acidimicrobiia bacterium]|nr:putative oxidoreductase [Acidimicrobiia bacterium]
MDSLVWLITGTSSGLGASFARSALEAGQTVVATARKPETLDALVADFGDLVLPLPLDVTDRAQVTSVVDQVVKKYGRLDVVVNNAGFGITGAIEEMSEEQSRSLMETNFFGAVWVTQAALPQMRTQRSGHIVNVSSISGVGSYPGTGMYAATKWALEAMSESLAGEVAPFGIKVTLLEPSRFRSQWWHGNLSHADPIDDYERVRRRALFPLKTVEEGDPDRAGALLVKLVHSPNPPLRLLMGNMAFDFAYDIYEKRVEEWKSWEAEGRATDYPLDERPVAGS